MIAVNNNFKCPTRRRVDLETDCEIVWVELITGRRPLFSGCFYRPPIRINVTDYNSLQQCFNSVMRVSKLGDFVLLGDFNLHIHWDNASSGTCTYDYDTFCYEHFITALELKQFCLSPT
jgi:hypothetical protein